MAGIGYDMQPLEYDNLIRFLFLRWINNYLGQKLT